MLLGTWLLFCVSAFLIAASPGPSVLHAVRYASIQGFSKATASIAGNTIAILFVCAMASIGLTAISDTIFFKIVEFVGAAYLIYLGIKMARNAGSVLNISHQTVNHSHKRIMLEAFVLSLANPKILIFVASFFPQFLKPTDNISLQFLIMSVTFTFFTASTLLIYIGIAMALFKNQKIIKIVDVISSMVLVYLGLKMFFSVNI